MLHYKLHRPKKCYLLNKQKNSNIKTEIENQITNLSIIDDEQKMQQNIKNEIEELKKQEESKKQKAEEERKAKERDGQQKTLNKHIISFFWHWFRYCFLHSNYNNEHKRKIRKKGVC